MRSSQSVVGDRVSALGDALTKARPLAPTIRRWGEHLAGVLGSGGHLLACGNGGSAAEAQHLTGELVGKFRTDRQPPPDAKLNDPADVAETVPFALRQPQGCEVRELVVACSEEGSWP